VPTRPLGATGLQVSPVGLGLAALGRPAYIDLGRDADLGADRSVDALERRCHQVLDAAWSSGVRYLDAARSYGRSEAFLGSWLRSRRLDPSEVTVGSKWGYTYVGDWRMDADTHEVKDHSLAALTRQTAESRALLGDHLDLYQVHWPNPLVPQRSTMAGMRTLQAGGLVRQVGVSNYGLRRWRAAEAAQGGPVVSNQVRYSLLTRRPERELLPHAAAAGRLIVAYSPLAQGVLAAKYTADTAPGGVRSGNLLFSAENLRRAEPVLAALRELARGHQATPAQVALAWLLAQKPWIVPIPGTRRVERLDENLAAATLELTADDLGEIERAAAQIQVQGARYPEHLQRLIDR
jgi:aryl-alcohol dehydrogenase-like predicted oxidoreductase